VKRKVQQPQDGTTGWNEMMLEVADVLALDRSDSGAQRLRQRVRVFARIHGHRPVRLASVCHLSRQRPRQRRERRAARSSSRGGDSGEGEPGEAEPRSSGGAA
jgi:hypothetical protein